MARYTVVITPDPIEGANGGVPQMTIQIDSGTPEPRITGIAINSTAAAGLTTLTMQDIDLPAIVAALASRILPPSATANPAGPPAHPAERQDPGPGEPPTRTAPVTGAPDTPLASAGRRGKSADNLVSVDGESGSTERVYRKMPDPSELRATYQRLGTVTGLAKHYGVPRHTAQGWMGRLRKMDDTA